MGSSDAGVYPRHASAPLASTCKSVFLPQSFRSVTPRLWPRGKILLAADSRPRSLHGAHLLLLCLFGRKDTGRDASHSILGSSLTFDRVKYKRRRQGKTDYRARLRMCTQDKNKYNTPKYRLVVRFTNSDVVCQIAYATLAGDVVVAAAYAHELPSFGLKVGLTNYAAAYCTGLLLARRALTKFGLAEAYEGNTEDVGEDFNVDANDEGPRPFMCILDTGLKRTSTGSKVFATLKGALDGGLDIPHSEKRFVGYDKEGKELDSEVLRKYIMGGHVAEYMEQMKEEEPEKYSAHFSQYIKEGLEADDLEDMYTKVHAAIRANPVAKKADRKKPAEAKRWKEIKLTYEQRKSNLKAKLAELTAE